MRVIRYIIFVFFLALPSLASAATFTLSPSSQTLTIGQTFDVNVVLDTSGVSAAGADLQYINYDPTIIEVQDASSTQSGVQIAPGTLFPNTALNSVDATTGKILFSQVAVDNVGYSGSGTFATITFKALKAGVSAVTIDAVAGNTADSNVASNGGDVLTSVTNGSYTVSAPIVPPPPPPGGGGGGGGGVSYSSGGGSAYYSSVANNIATTTATSTVIMKSFTFTTWLIYGYTNAQVKELQKVLNANGYKVAVAGPGSPGNETTYFDANTLLAVQKFQCAKLFVCYGTPTTTGYGAIGPLTRRALSLLTYPVEVSQPSLASIQNPFCPVGYTCTPKATEVVQCPVGYTCTAKTATSTVIAAVSYKYKFTRSLTVGSTGNDVKELQKFLNGNGFTVSLSGAGAVGHETSYFGPATKAAVAKFQVANGITPTVGFFGPITREAVNAK